MSTTQTATDTDWTLHSAHWGLFHARMADGRLLSGMGMTTSISLGGIVEMTRCASVSRRDMKRRGCRGQSLIRVMPIDSHDQGYATERLLVGGPCPATFIELADRKRLALDANLKLKAIQSRLLLETWDACGESSRRSCL